MSLNVLYTQVLWYSVWSSCKDARTTLVANRWASYVLDHLPSSSSSNPGISRANSAGWRGRRPNGHSDWHVRQSRGSAFPSAINSAHSSMKWSCTRLPCSHGTCTGMFMPPYPHIGHPGSVRSNSMARSPPLLPVCPIIAILHLVRSPRHLPPAARSPKATLSELLAAALIGSAANPHVEPR